ncbi:MULTISPECIES: nucleoside 2-deoxyribosyltransferase domain-containing protein [unclassified Aureispira]|uniref:nucleoside 2-deoxyribosyltransferase domain-containing protein n=1 Tax=unclassified Aureispira TaxID=2649989 RepID=UPI0009DFD37E|nr:MULTISPECIES: nucleoside 2-deoxyribosyltransferase domain-containing protein [unclassified Aureispira]WMX14015.1 nucleoside 2-deoxyribosyltransferase domain-containing protein [Aureispira sp. CCB-E]
MHHNTIFPPHYPKIDTQVPVIFLAGPIQGAPAWHSEAIDYLQRQASNTFVASPKKAYLDKDFVYEQQVDWESYFLKRAATCGCILFWLAKEKEHFSERAYAQTSRFELGEWAAKQAALNCNLVVGIEEGFSGARYIRRRLQQQNPAVLIASDLKETCNHALKLLR